LKKYDSIKEMLDLTFFNNTISGLKVETNKYNKYEVLLTILRTILRITDFAAMNNEEDIKIMFIESKLVEHLQELENNHDPMVIELINEIAHKYSTIKSDEIENQM